MAKSPDLPEAENIKNLAYRAIQRQAYAGYTHEHAQHCRGGAEALYGGIKETLDVERPHHEYWGDFIEAVRDLCLKLHESRAEVQLLIAETHRVQDQLDEAKSRLADYDRQMSGALW